MAEQEKKPAALWKKLLLLFVTLLLCLAASEGVVRLRYPQFGIPVHEARLFTEFDPLLGWRLAANFRGQHIQEEYTIVEQINSKSLRGPEFPYEKPAGTYRILILGDSFAEGYTVEFRDLFSQIMREKLNDALDKNIEIINAGTGGYGTDQELLFFQQEGKKYQPDLTVLLFFVNDLTFNIRSYYGPKKRGEKPLFELKDGQLKLKSKPKATWSRQEELAKDKEKNPVDDSFAPWKLESWFLYRLVRYQLTGRTPNGIDPLPGTPTEPEPQGPQSDPPAADPSKDAKKQQLKGVNNKRKRREWQMAEALLAKVRDETKASGSQFLLFYVPYRGEIYKKDRTVSDKSSRLEYNLKVIAGRNDIDFIDTVSLFQAQATTLAKDDKYLYWKKDPHWTAEGHHLTGLILCEHIKKNCVLYGLCDK